MANFFTFKVDVDGNIIEEVSAVYINGYQVGERILEDVMFRIKPTNDRKDIIVEVVEDSAEYFNKLNTKKWLKEVKNCAINYDVFSLSEYGSDDDGALYDKDKPYSDQGAYYDSEPVFP